MKYANHFSTRETPQSEPIPDTDQVPNSAGGYTWAVDDWKRLDRFLVLGSEGGTYYIGEHKLTVENAQSALRCIKEDGARVVNRVIEISEAGRAPKNDPALFVLAMCAGKGDFETRKAALLALPKVARIGTHLFHFLEYCKAFRGWGRGLRKAIARWYNEKEPAKLAYQVVKYRQRDGWSHKDALRLAHPKAPTNEHNAIYNWVVGKEGLTGDTESHYPFGLIIGYERAQRAEKSSEIVSYIQSFRLTREMIPTQFLSEPTVWEALLEKMPMTALIRNLGNMSKIGLLVKGNWDAVNRVTGQIGNEEQLQKSRMHPLQVLAALNTYAQGHGFRGRGEWEPVPQVIDVLDAAFYKAFGNVEPTGKNIVLALDVSGSMTWSNIAGVGGITPRVGSAAMALITAAVEKRWTIMAFSHRLVEANISPRQRLDDVCKTLGQIPMGGTDCALPMLDATKKRIKDIDAFVIYTDNETWAGQVHPLQALQEYRRKFNSQARLAVVGMVSNEFSIADPDDAGMMDVVGFDTATPNLISNFIANRV